MGALSVGFAIAVFYGFFLGMIVGFSLGWWLV
jgi:hypothetical protein